MSERKPQSRLVPLRVRLRTPSEQLQWERTHTTDTMHTTPTTGPPVPGDPSTVPTSPVEQAISSELLQRSQQIKELIRLGSSLRVELGLNEVLQQITASIHSCTGFRILVINLLEESNNYLTPVAFAGVPEVNVQRLREGPITVEQMYRLLRPEFRISQSFFIPHEQMEQFADMVWSGEKAVDTYEPGDWHPNDALFVPLYSPRKQQILGLLSVDEPEDGKIPSLESIEILELFANQAAVFIDNARIFEEREAEHQALAAAVAELRNDLARVQNGDLRLQIRSSHEKLQPISDALNKMIQELSGLIGNAQMVTQAADEYSREVQHSSDRLVHDTAQQERQVQHISHVIADIAATMNGLSERANKLSTVAFDAMNVMTNGRKDVDRAAEGMMQVREATMVSTRIMKRLGESEQEINEIMSTLGDISTRMHLLALNTAIEATRTGEHGQGFTTIAQEMRTLATSSTETAKKVAAHIRTIQRETSTVSQSIEQSTSHVVMQTELVTQTGISLDAISIVTEQMADLVEGIRAAADSQVQGSQMVVDAVEQISSMASEIMQHMFQMQQSLDHLGELTNALRSRISLIRVNEP